LASGLAVYADRGKIVISPNTKNDIGTRYSCKEIIIYDFKDHDEREMKVFELIE
jgi:hypothetical protein